MPFSNAKDVLTLSKNTNLRKNTQKPNYNLLASSNEFKHLLSVTSKFSKSQTVSVQNFLINFLNENNGKQIVKS